MQAGSKARASRRRQKPTFELSWVYNDMNDKNQATKILHILPLAILHILLNVGLIT
jgi:hypothetical protein